MENGELEEKVMIMEELIQGFVKRIHGVETEVQTFFKSALVHYKETLGEIANSVKKASQHQENSHIARQIEELKSIIATMPKVFTVKNNHHFGAWSKSFIISVTIAFVVTALSLGTALYLNNENDKLKGEAFNFWLVRALYPNVSLAVEKGLKEDQGNLVKRAAKGINRRHAIMKAEIEAVKAEKTFKTTKEKLENLKSGN